MEDPEMAMIKSRAMSQASIMTGNNDKADRPCPDCWYIYTRIYCIWEEKCPPFWEPFQKKMQIICNDPFLDLFITLCIVINTGFMANEMKPSTPSWDTMLSKGNIVSIQNIAIATYMYK